MNFMNKFTSLLFLITIASTKARSVYNPGNI